MIFYEYRYFICSILVDQAMYTADLPTGKPSEPENASQLEVNYNFNY